MDSVVRKTVPISDCTVEKMNSFGSQRADDAGT